MSTKLHGNKLKEANFLKKNSISFSKENKLEEILKAQKILPQSVNVLNVKEIKLKFVPSSVSKNSGKFEFSSWIFLNELNWKFEFKTCKALKKKFLKNWDCY